MKHTDILDFWFDELTHEERFNGGVEIDERITNEFTEVHQAVAANECADWREVPEGALAEIIVLDQFSRNIYRGEARAFAFDGHALALAQNAIAREHDEQLSETQRLFMYLPFMHSESAVIHERAAALFTALGNQEALQFEQLHKDIVDRFGRYPHRNEQLGRQSTANEEEYLQNTEHGFFAS